MRHGYACGQEIVGDDPAMAPPPQHLGAHDSAAPHVPQLTKFGQALPEAGRPGVVREIAERLAKLPPLTSSYTRIALTQKLRRIVDEGVGYGLALEGISAADVARAKAAEG